MPVYNLSVVARRGIATPIATTDLAAEALSVLRGTAQLHARVWVSDADGNDICEEDLVKLAAAEKHELSGSHRQTRA